MARASAVGSAQPAHATCLPPRRRRRAHADLRALRVPLADEAILKDSHEGPHHHHQPLGARVNGRAEEA